MEGEFHTSERRWENEMVINLINKCPTAILWNIIKEAPWKLMLRENTMILFPYFKLFALDILNQATPLARIDFFYAVLGICNTF